MRLSRSIASTWPKPAADGARRRGYDQPQQRQRNQRQGRGGGEQAGQSGDRLQRRSQDQRQQERQADRHADDAHHLAAVLLGGEIRRQRDAGAGHRAHALHRATDRDAGERVRHRRDQPAQREQQQTQGDRRLAPDAVGQQPQRNLQQHLADAVDAQRQPDHEAGGAGHRLRVQREHRHDQEQAEQAQADHAGQRQRAAQFQAREFAHRGRDVDRGIAGIIRSRPVQRFVATCRGATSCNPYNHVLRRCDASMNSMPADATRPADFAQVRDLAAADMQRVDALIRQRLSSDVVLINQIADHIIAGGGKRLRPMLHVLAAGAAGYRGERHTKLAAIIEFIHTSTLLHDDVVDESDLRRGRKTANALWGNAASVLVGDFLYSRSFQLMVELDDMRIMRILADTTNTIAEGEVLQLLNIGNADVSESAYLAVIERKTAVLFAAATELGGILGGLPEKQVDALRRYGMELGYAFQIADDLLDYTSDAGTLGKNIGDDLAEGKPTLPLIYALEKANPEQAQSLRHAIEHGGLDSLDRIIASIRDSGALERTRERALRHAHAARAALATLPASAHRDALATLADYSVRRTF
jgi:octaprenyl-diphosphate synthase